MSVKRTDMETYSPQVNKNENEGLIVPVQKMCYFALTYESQAVLIRLV